MFVHCSRCRSWRSFRWARRTSRSISARSRSARSRRRFSPIVGTWIVTKDGDDTVIMVDGRPWVARQDNPTKLLLESARKFYGASNEEFMDNVKQFAYFPIAILNGLDNFTNGTISLKFKTDRRDQRPLLRHPLQRQAERRLAGRPLQRHREQHRALDVP